jgi:hypothetical protein
MKPTEYNFPRVVRHVYDVDAFETLDKLKEKYLKHIDFIHEQLRDLEFIKLEEELLIKQFKEDDFDLTEHQKHRNFIIPSNYNLYCTYLGYKLLTIDLYKIEPLLSYQSVLFLGNYYATKDNFLGLIEFLVYDFVKVRLLPFEQIRLEKMVNWLERNRSFILQQSFTSKIVAMEPDFANILYQKLQPFFANEQHSSLHELIFKGNKSTAHLCFAGNQIELVDLFKRLRHNQKIVVNSNKTLCNWIFNNFEIQNKKEGEPNIQLNYDVVLDYLSRDERVPKGKSRVICEEIAPYISKEERKKRQIK